MKTQTIKTRERIGVLLYFAAIILLLINIFWKGESREIRWIDIVGWLVFMVAALYAIWLSKVKNKISDIDP